jgi:hypothetical protein
MTDVTIINDKTSDIFLFKTVSNIKNKLSQPSIDVPFIGATPANRLIFKYTGQSQDITFNFVLYDDGTDVSNGTHTSAVITLTQQITYLLETFYSSQYDAKFNLMCSEEGLDINGAIESIELDTPTGGQVRTGSLTFKRGTLVGGV